MEGNGKMAKKEPGKLFKRLTRFLGWLALSVAGLVVLVLLLIQLPLVQNFAREKVVAYLQHKLHTTISIEKLNINFPASLSLQKVYIEDLSKDTLLYGDHIRVDISMLRLLRNEINIQKVNLDGIIAHLHREPPDTAFNFQFIIDAFATEGKEETHKTDSSAWKISLKDIRINHSHFVYKDLRSGNDLDIGVKRFQTTINRFDPAEGTFVVNLVDIQGVRGYFYQLEPTQPLAEKVEEAPTGQQDKEIRLVSKTLRLADINFQFNSDPSHLKSSYVIGKAELHPRSIDLKKMVFALKETYLDNSDIVIQTNSGLTAEPATDTSVNTAGAPSFQFISDRLILKDLNFKMDDHSKPLLPSGMDFNHLSLTGLNVQAKDLLYSADTMRAALQSASLKDRSGFVLNKMQTDFEMNPAGIILKNLYIKTPASEIKKYVAIRYPGLKEVSEKPALLGLKLNLNKSTIAVEDLLFFVPRLEPQLAAFKKEALSVDALLSGTLGNMVFQKLILSGFSGTGIDLHGTLAGLPDPDKISADLNIEKISTNKHDILAFLPPSTLPSNIQLPSRIQASGTFRGGMNDLNTSLGISTNLGDLRLNGKVKNLTAREKTDFDIKIEAKDLQLGAILSNPELGYFMGVAEAEGTGLDPKTANAHFKIDIPELGFHQYTYKNIFANGRITNGEIEAGLLIKDPNLSTELSLNSKLSGNTRSATLNGVIDSIDVQAIHYSDAPLKYHGRISADFSNIDPDSLNGRLAVTHSIIATGKQRIALDTISVVSATGDSGSISLNAGFASLDLKGQYQLTQLGDVFTNAINPFFRINDSAVVVKTDPYHFSLTGAVYNHQVLKALFPELENMQEIRLRSNFDYDKGWSLDLSSPHLQYKELVIDSVKLTAGDQDSIPALNFTMGRFTNGSSISIYKTTIDAVATDQTLTLGLKISDKDGKEKYAMKGGIFEDRHDHYVFKLHPGLLRLNYENWGIDEQNSIQFGKKELSAKNFVLTHGDEMLSINSDSSGLPASLRLSFSNFKISTLSGMVQMDSSIVGGVINGNIAARELLAQPTFTADLTVDHLSIYKDTLGVLTVKVNNEITDRYNAMVSLKGQGNDITVNGDYFVRSPKIGFDFVLEIKQFQMKSLEGLTNGAVRDAGGFMYGRIKVSGDPDDKNIDGHIQFNNTSFIPARLNNVFKINNESIAFINNEGIRFDSFTIRDTTNNALVLCGMIYTEDWTNYRFDMNIRADDFQAINSTSADNPSFYGKLIFSTELHIKGTPTQPVIDGDLSVNDKTAFTIVLPTADPAIEEREGIVRFVDYSATPEDSLFLTAFDSLNTVSVIGYDVAVNIDISKKAEFNLIVDPANGDFLRMRGAGHLSGGIDPGGKINLTGDYQVEEGDYSLSFNFLKRKFLIQKGSKIVWTGDPTSARVDVTAVYETNTAPLELVESVQTGNNIYYKQKIPFEVQLKMQGELLKPQISFDIVLPDKNYTVSSEVINTVEERLLQLRQEPSDLNKQVFALLLLNRFIGEDPFGDSNTGGMDAAAFARQSASRLLTEQINNLTEGLIQGVDLNFDLATTEDYTTGEKQDRTNLNIGVTKRMLDDRLSVTIGNNFELEGPQQSNQDHLGLADNINITYSLSKDGRYMLRAYRVNDYTGALEGYVIETGISFVITLDYDKLSDIFLSKEKRENKKEVRQRNRAIKTGDEDNERAGALNQTAAGRD